MWWYCCDAAVFPHLKHKDTCVGIVRTASLRFTYFISVMNDVYGF